jgi:hypothetical protein
VVVVVVVVVVAAVVVVVLLSLVACLRAGSLHSRRQVGMEQHQWLEQAPRRCERGRAQYVFEFQI